MIGQGTTVLAVKHGSNFRGTGGFSTAYPTAIDFYFSATASNNTLTLVACNSCRPKEDSYPLETMAVESITGIL